MPQSRRHRSYESPLRAEQVDRTRDKLIQAGVDLMASGARDELSVRRVAAHAGVSVPTAYRYFPNRDALIGALVSWASAEISGTLIPARVEGLPEWARGIFAVFDANDRLVRAQLNTPAARSIRSKDMRRRNAQVVELVGRSFPSAPEASRRRLAAMIRLILNLRSWVALRDDWGMDGDEAGEVTAWAVTALVAEFRRQPLALDFERAGADAPEVPSHAPGKRAAKKRR